GASIGENDEIRTAKGSRAMLRLTDGSLVEVSERADLSLSRGWRGATIRLDRGNVIVQAAPQHRGLLYVSTGDCLVSVKGTIFAVSRGTKGSRVSVLQGLVKVRHGAVTQLLHPGQQDASTAALEPVPIAQQISWSADSGKYLALLADFSTLGKQIESIPSPGLRYSSTLAADVPPDTVVYAAIPNLAGTLTQVGRMFDQRAQQSDALREWWTAQRGANLRQLLSQAGSFNQYLGNEIVIAVSPDASGRLRGSPVLLAEVTRPGLDTYLATQFKGAIGVYLKNNLLALSPDAVSLAKAEASIAHPGAFLQTPFYQHIAPSYQAGAGWLFAADMEQIVKSSVPPTSMAAVAGGALNNVSYLMVERRETGGRTDNRAVLNFTGPRHGPPSWLAAPAPMGSLDFVSPNAALAASFAVKNPAAMLQDILSVNAGVARALSQFESATGVDPVNDIAGALGGDVTFAVDGPLLPVPAWKLAIEVYDPARLEMSIERLIDTWNRQNTSAQGKLTLSKSQSGSTTFYALTAEKMPFETDYTFIDGYWLLAPSRALLDTAIQNRAAGVTLIRSTTFQSLVPSDGYTNFSGVVYYDLGGALAPVAAELKALGVLSPSSQASLDTFSQNNAPGLIYAYGGTDKIAVATGGSMFQLALDAMIGGSAGLLPRAMVDLKDRSNSPPQ
ncbi:MAG: FecR domain-containing protein, partial [Bryobacteraceae bacterium]